MYGGGLLEITCLCRIFDIRAEPAIGVEPIDIIGAWVIRFAKTYQ